MQWASRCLTPIAPYLSPPPQFCVVQHTKGEVLVIATDRSVGFVPCTEKDRKPTYFLRIHDQTLAAPDYLASDLILGKRQHPYLAITEVVTSVGGRREGRQAKVDWCFETEFTIENQGLSRAENVMVGLVNLSTTEATGSLPVSNHLRKHITTIKPDESKYKADVPALRQHVADLAAVEPFTLKTALIAGCVSAPLRWVGGFYIPYAWKAAVYLTAEGAPPRWHQLSIEIDSPLLKHLRSSGRGISSMGPFLCVERLTAGRPVVGWVGDKI